MRTATANWAAGLVFSLDPATGAETVVYTFHGGDGYFPQAPLLAVDHRLYGTTALGGVYGDGTLFVLEKSR